MNKIDLIRAIETKVARAKPIALKPFKSFLIIRTKAQLESILKTVRVSRDGFDITFKY